LPPVVGPLVGGVIGALIYDFFIGRTLMRAQAVRVPASGMDPTHSEPSAPKNV
jgi:glycerol uptake facilitator protein